MTGRMRGQDRTGQDWAGQGRGEGANRTQATLISLQVGRLAWLNAFCKSRNTKKPEYQFCLCLIFSSVCPCLSLSLAAEPRRVESGRTTFQSLKLWRAFLFFSNILDSWMKRGEEEESQMKQMPNTPPNEKYWRNSSFRKQNREGKERKERKKRRKNQPNASFMLYNQISLMALIIGPRRSRQTTKVEPAGWLAWWYFMLFVV